MRSIKLVSYNDNTHNFCCSFRAIIVHVISEQCMQTCIIYHLSVLTNDLNVSDPRS